LIFVHVGIFVVSLEKSFVLNVTEIQ